MPPGRDGHAAERAVDLRSARLRLLPARFLAGRAALLSGCRGAGAASGLAVRGLQVDLHAPLLRSAEGLQQLSEIGAVGRQQRANDHVVGVDRREPQRHDGAIRADGGDHLMMRPADRLDTGDVGEEVRERAIAEGRRVDRADHRAEAGLRHGAYRLPPTPVRPES